MIIENPQGPVPREIAKWLDSLDLAYEVRNFRRDLANGFVVAEILSRKYPNLINIYTVYNEQNLQKKKDNWELIAKVLSKKNFPITNKDYEPIYHQAPGAAEEFIFKLYEFMKEKKLAKIFPDKDVRDPKKNAQVNKQVTLLRTKPLPVLPSYARPTANQLIKDREIIRIIDDNDRKYKTQLAIINHDEKARQEKKDENIIEYLILKRKKQIEDEIRKQEEELLKKQMKFNKKLVSLDQSMTQNQQQDVKEIQINCYHSSTSKKAKESQGQYSEAKGVLDFLHEATANLFKKDPIQTDIKLLKLEPKEGQQNNGFQSSNQNVTYTNVIQQLFLRCDEVQKKSLRLLINQFVDVNHVLILEQVQSNFIDFKRFFTIFVKPLQVLKKTSKTYLQILEMIKFIGSKLVETDGHDTQMMFENILLESLLQVALKNPNKREDIVQLFYIFAPATAHDRLHLCQAIKSKIPTNLSSFVLILACLIQMEYFDMEQDFIDYFAQYATLALDSPSPLTRTNGLAILKELARWDFIEILRRLDKIQKLMDDTWWEVRAQGMCICADLLLAVALEEEQQQNRSRDAADVIEQTQNFSQFKQQLLDIIYSVFQVQTSQNVIRLGLIYLAPVLQKYPDLCTRYLEILLSVDPDIRITILNTELPIQIGQVVQGCNTFKYHLTGAPINWNSVGVAQAMDDFVKENQLQTFQIEHLEIILGCLYNDLQPADGDIWLKIFEDIKNLLFLAFSEQDLCQYAQEILKKFFMFQTIQKQVLLSSQKIFLKLLTLTYHPDIDKSCKQNLLEFFVFLQQQKFQNYCYDIIKQFSENNKNLFLNSNLVDFMNSLAKDKRKEILGEESY